MKGRNVTRGKVFTGNKRPLDIKLPFQYTDEGRAQLAAKRKLIIPTKIVTSWDEDGSTIKEVDFGQIEARIDAAMKSNPAINRFYTTIDTALPRDPSRDRFYTTDTALDSAGNPCPPEQSKPERKVVRSHASYLSDLFECADVCVQKFRIAMRAVDFDTLVGTGLSGTLAAQLFARAIGVNFAIVRKAGDGTHSMNRIEGTIGKRWVFVDDLVSSGDTRRRVREAMDEFCRLEKFESEYVGQYLYYGNKFEGRENGNV
jgi:hypothetical protein